MQLSRFLGLVVAAFVLAACAHTPAPQASRPPTILISIDGFRADYLDRGITPVLSKLAAEGARGAMRPSFPSKTFPNHYTLVTGLRPDRHGMVDNTMEDPQIPGATFRLADRSTVTDPRWWTQGTPIWVSAEQAGLKTAPIFWPGSETQIQGVRPTYWALFDMSRSADARVDDTLTLLHKPPGQKPAFLTLYFDEVDTQGHRFGPDSAEVNDAIAKTDAAVGRLAIGLASRGIVANLVIVADHGMAATAPERVIYLDDLLPVDAGRTLGLGAFMTYVPARGREAEAEAALLKPRPHLRCWRKGEIPARFHYGRNPRVPPIFCLPDTGWEIITKAWVRARAAPKGGNHGFDPYAPEMRAIFIGSGPAFRPGARLADFDNVDVYPLLARLMGVKPLPNDGDLREVRPGLKR